MRTTLVALAASLALLAAASTATASPAATAAPTSRCWLDVVNDWLDNGRVDRTYAIPCYTQAIQHLNLYPDVRQYSNATDDIQRALLAAIRQDRGSGPGTGAGPAPGPTDTTGGTTAGTGTKPPNGPTASHGGGFLGGIGPSDAQSIPLPLLVLGILALLLLAAAGATWVTRRHQARRVAPPTPAHAPAVPKRR